MRVLHVCATDAGSGAAIAAYRFHAALKRHTDIDSKMLVSKKRTEDDDVILIHESFVERMWLRFRKFLDKILSNLIYKSRTTEQRLSLCVIPHSQIVNKIKKLKPDIVHFHWIHDGIFFIKDLERVPCPVFCTMHDTWYASLGQYIKNEKDVDSFSNNLFYKLKANVYDRKKPVFLAVSTWMKILAEKSLLLKNHQVHVVNNCIDTEFFKPVDKTLARKILNITADKVILFGASNYSRNKGENFIEMIIDHFGGRTDVIFVFFGRKNKIARRNVIQAGQLFDPLSLILYYSAATVLVSPSFQESFGLVIAEAMACGTPAVAFNSTGPKDIIDHKTNGYLAKPYEIKDLIDGIDWILNNDHYSELSKKSTDKIKRELSFPVSAGKLADQYKKQVLNS